MNLGVIRAMRKRQLTKHRLSILGSLPFLFFIQSVCLSQQSVTLMKNDTSWLATKSYVAAHGGSFDSSASLAYTKSLISGKMAYSDTASLSARINSKMGFADTASLSARINGKQASGTYLIPSDTSSLVARFAAKQAAGTYLIPGDSTTLKTSVLSQVLKNADSTTLKNSVLSQTLKNADSVGMVKRVDTSWIATEGYVDRLKKSTAEYYRSNADTWLGPDNGGMTTAPTTQACVASTVRAFPFYVGKGYTIDSVRFEVSTGVAGAQIALAIYDDSDGDMYPDTRLLALGAYTCAAAAVKGDTVTAPLGASTSNGTFTFQSNHLYFIGVASNSNATLRAVAQTSMPHLLGWNSALATNTQYTAWNKTATTYTYPNACPDPYPSSAAFLANTACPLVIWRVKP